MPNLGGYPTAEPTVDDFAFGPNAAGSAKKFPAPEPLGRALAIVEYTDSATLALSDAGKIVEANKATAMTITVPPNSSVAFPIKARLDIVRMGAGTVTLVPGSGVTIRSAAGALAISAQYGGVSLYKRGTNEWVAMGLLA